MYALIAHDGCLWPFDLILTSYTKEKNLEMYKKLEYELEILKNHFEPIFKGFFCQKTEFFISSFS